MMKNRMMMGPPPKLLPQLGFPLPINVLNAAAPLLSNKDILDVIPSLQKQLDNDFAPAWGVSAQLKFITKADMTTPTLVFLQSATQVNVHQGSNGVTLGFHDLTTTEMPYAFVFVKENMDSGIEWSATASHEILEMVVDPFVGGWAEAQFQGQLTYFAYEVGDPVQNDVYKINGIQVSNFVLPSWFISKDRGRANKWDFLDKLTGPLTVDDGGDSILFFKVGKHMVLQGEVVSSPSSKPAMRMRRPSKRKLVAAHHHEKSKVPGSRWWRRLQQCQ